MNILKSRIGRKNIQTKKSQRFFQSPGSPAGIKWRYIMPTISLFYGIIIYMFYFDNKEHKAP
ncbi:hypothetical protein [Desulfonatronovibrio magnus]|uniref:hypothetical protein n=1 Tax=Desulfonatronovibrio magnus TaxID=698827 RepID=UPI0018DC7C57|nr:hypothetical protein [Desulfonatronovibrio magnus]